MNADKIIMTLCEIHPHIGKLTAPEANRVRLYLDILETYLKSKSEERETEKKREPEGPL